MAQPKVVAIQSPSATPTSPSKRPVMITQGQKQALIDNLQLEITDRARKLRAQYALQAQSLRTRIELRVNRIPTATRKAKIGELYEKYIESTEQRTKPNASQSALATEASLQRPRPAKGGSPSKEGETAPAPRGVKRASDHFSADDDKENTPDPTHPLSAKKHPKHNTYPSNPSTVLSPKSSNPRNKSPVRSQLGSPQKSYPSHPASPLKPSGGFSALKPEPPAKAAAVAATAAASAVNATTDKPRATRTRAAAAASKPARAPIAAAPKTRAAPNTRAKRGAENSVEVPKHELRTVSAASNTSTGTTVVRKNGKGAGTGGVAGAKVKGKEASEKFGKGVGKKGVTAAAPPATVKGQSQGRRVLRKRG
ncbi:MAG: hypothetical protein Q9211_001263 [Gyalolechia sp. 1 TL-2023]